MEEERTGKEITRRRLIKRLGVGTAAAWLAPIVTSLGSRAEAGEICTCQEPCNWTCGGILYQCGSGCGPLGTAYCSHDVDGNCFCWEDDFCISTDDCSTNADCPPGWACIPTCCPTSGNGKCLAGCGLGPRRKRRHGRMASGKTM
jgi:hypothetical protein